MAASELCAACGVAAGGAASCRPEPPPAQDWGACVGTSGNGPWRSVRSPKGREGRQVAVSAKNSHCQTLRKSRYKELAEAAWRRVMEAPLDGLPFTGDDFSAALGRFDLNIEPGSMVMGTIIKADSRGLLVDVGAKASARVPLREASLRHLLHPEAAGLWAGARAEFVVLESDDGSGGPVLSVREMQRQLAWERCRQLRQEAAAVVLAQVVSSNRGGLLLDVEGIRGFLPLAQLSNYAERDHMVGRRLPVVVLEADEAESRLICSNRRAEAALRPAIAVGTLVEGVVRVVKPWGAFVDIGRCQALLHISQISAARLEDVGAVFAEGDTIKAIVTEDDAITGRVGVNTKLLEGKPGDMVTNRALVFEQAKERAESQEMKRALQMLGERRERMQQRAASGETGSPNGQAHRGSWMRTPAPSDSWTNPARGARPELGAAAGSSC